MLFKFPAAKDSGHTWLFLINGGEKSFAEEKVARDELKKICHCFVSNKLVKPEHVVCVNGGKEKLFQHETITNVLKVSSVIPRIPIPVNPTTQSGLHHGSVSYSVKVAMCIQSSTYILLYLRTQL